MRNLLIAGFVVILCGCESNSTPRVSLADRYLAERKERELKEQQALDARVKEYSNQRERECKAYVDAHPELSKEIQNAILNRRLLIGMTAEQVRVSWPLIDKINTFTDANGVREQWIHGSTYLYFDQGILTSIQRW